MNCVNILLLPGEEFLTLSSVYTPKKSQDDVERPVSDDDITRLSI